MCLSNLPSSELIALSGSLAVVIGQNLTSDETAILASFFTSLGDNLAIIATTK